MAVDTQHSGNTRRQHFPDSARGLRYVELYAGMGGWTFALEAAMERIGSKQHTLLPEVECAAALDHSDLCIKVLRHLRPSLPGTNSTCRLEQLSAAQVQSWSADIWCMSPPCQPHTRQHQNQDQDAHDDRSQSFLHLVNMLQTLPDQELPRMLVLENVTNFERSTSCGIWRTMLTQRGYVATHLALSPPLVGIPNDRPRYYSVALLKTVVDDQHALGRYFSRELDDLSSPLTLITSIPELNVKERAPSAVATLAEICLDLEIDTDASLQVPDKLLQGSASWCLDLVTPSSRRSSCFTSSYGKYAKGTGSVLYTGRTSRGLVIAEESLRPLTSAFSTPSGKRN